MSDPVSRPGRSGMRTRGGTALAAWLVLLLAGIVWTTGPGTAHAASGTTARDRMVPGSLVSRLRANGAELTRLAPAHGLEGWNVRLADGSSYILYLTPDGAGLIGHLYGPDGRSVTVRHLQALARDRTGTGNTPLPDHAVPAAALPANPPAPSNPGSDGVQSSSRPAPSPAGVPPGSGPGAPAAVAAGDRPARSGHAGGGSAFGDPACAPGAGEIDPAGFAAHGAGERSRADRTGGVLSMTGTRLSAAVIPSQERADPSRGTPGGDPGAARSARAQPSAGASFVGALVPRAQCPDPAGPCPSVRAVPAWRGPHRRRYPRRPRSPRSPAILLRDTVRRGRRRCCAGPGKPPASNCWQGPRSFTSSPIPAAGPRAVGSTRSCATVRPGSGSGCCRSASWERRRPAPPVDPRAAGPGGRLVRHRRPADRRRRPRRDQRRPACRQQRAVRRVAGPGAAAVPACGPGRGRTHRRRA